MNKFFLLAASVMMFSATTATAQDKAEAKNDTAQFTVIKANPVTSIKDQNQSGTCWAFSSLSFLEAELLRMGKGEYDLSESFLAYHTYLDRADRAIRTHGDVSFSQGGSFYDAIYCLKNYGMVPQEAMTGTLYGDSLFNFNQLDAVASAYVNALAKGKQKTINPAWKSDLSNIYANYFGARRVYGSDGPGRSQWLHLCLGCRRERKRPQPSRYCHRARHEEGQRQDRL